MSYKDYINSLLERKSDFDFMKVSDFLHKQLGMIIEERYNKLYDGFIRELNSEPDRFGYRNFDSSIHSDLTDYPSYWDASKSFVNDEDFQSFGGYKTLKKFPLSYNQYSIIVDIDNIIKADGSVHDNAKAAYYKYHPNRRSHLIRINPQTKISPNFTLEYSIDHTLSFMQLLIYYYNHNHNIETIREEAETTLKENIESIIEFFTKSNKFKTSFIHEVRHFYDYIKYGDEPLEHKLSKKTIQNFDVNFRKISGEGIDNYTKEYLKYFSNNSEQNAHYSMLVNALMEWLLSLDEQTIKDTEPNLIYKQFNSEIIDKNRTLSDKLILFDMAGTKQKIISRLFNFINIYRNNIKGEISNEK